MKTIGVYIHIPFCASKCAYCDFNSKAGCDKLMPDYQKAIIKHIKEAEKQLSAYYIDTIYFGGGTPSYYGAERLIEILDTLKYHSKVLLDCEITLEANPDSVNLTMLQQLKKAGFNRISFGVQSANDKILRNIGRRHTFAQAEKAIDTARGAGFKNISIDLMYGLPSQTKTDWAETLKRALGLKPEHISCYGLKLEEGTPLYSFKDTPFIPDDDTQADMYLYAVAQLKEFGYRQYEISNFSEKGFESIHNLKYWQCKEYIGFGAGAHSYMGGLRYSNIKDIKQYIDSINSDGNILDEHEEISQFGKSSEYLMLGLRTTYGISRQEYHDIFPCNFTPIERYLEKCAEHGWAEKNNDRWNLTPNGFLISNVLIGDILELQQGQWSSRNKLLGQSTEDILQQLSMFPKEKHNITVFKGG